MKKDRRKKIIRFVEIAAVSAVVLDVAVYFLAILPLQQKILRDENSYRQVFAQVQRRRQHVVQLEKFNKALPAAEEHLRTFLKDHVPTRRRVFSDSAHLVRVLTQQSGVQLQSVSYKLSSEKDEPLDRLGLDVTVQGPFPNLLRFAHSLETAEDLILVKSFMFSAGEGGTVTLRVSGVLYLTP